MAINPGRQQELTHIQTDAALHSQSSDQQTSNRLQLEVNQFLKDHHSSQDVKDLTSRLTAGGLRNDEIQSLEKHGFPTPQFDYPTERPTRIADSTSPVPDSARTQNARSTDGNQSRSDSPSGAPQKPSFHDVMNEVYQAEGNYNHHAPGDQASSERSMQKALKDVQQYLQQNPDDAPQMLRKLTDNHLMPQLSVVALNDAVKQKETATGKSIDSLSRQEALQLLSADRSPLGKALSASMDRSFSPKQADGTTPEGFKGNGYADAGRSASGHDTIGVAGAGDQPVITRKHLNDLMEHFDREPLPANQQPDLDKDKPNSFMEFLRHPFS